MIKLGLINLVADQVPLGRLHCRPLQYFLRSKWIMAVDTRNTRIHLENISNSAPEVVTDGEQSDSGNRTIKQNTSDQPIHRCIERRMGSPSGKQRNIVDMEQQTSKNAYKCIGNESGLPSSRTLQGRSERKIYPSSNRQHNNIVIYKSPRRNKIMDLHAGNISNIRQDSQHAYGGNDKSNTHPEEIECSSRPTESEESNIGNIMVYPPRNFGRVVENLEQTPCRPVCNKIQCQTTIVRESNSGRLHFSGRCSNNGLVQPIWLRLSSYRITETGNQEDSSTQMHNHLNSTTLARPIMVSRSSETTHGTPNTSTHQPNASPTTTEPYIPSIPTETSFTSMEAIQKGVMNMGFSEEVSKQIGGAVTKSSQDVY